MKKYENLGIDRKAEHDIIDHSSKKGCDSMLEDKLYTLQELAELTRLTNRTLRNYLANGTLKGHKVGGQWRFTKDEVCSLFKNDTFYEDRKDKSDHMMKAFIDQKIELSCKKSAGIVIDLKETTKEERKKFYQSLDQIPKDENLKEKVSFISDDGHVRLHIVASLQYIGKVIDLLKEE